MHEMETASRYKLPIVYFLLNNNRLGLIDKHAVSILKGNPISEKFIDINWCQIAQSFGWATKRIEASHQLDKILPEVFSTKVPMLVECRISPNEVAPDFYIALKKHENKKYT